MTDLEKYLNLFESTSVEFSLGKFQIKNVVGTKTRNGTLDNGQVIQIEIPIYETVVHTSLEVYGNTGYGTAVFGFDENGKYDGLNISEY